MPSKRFGDVSPEFGDKDGSRETLKGKTGKPGNPGAGSFSAPTHSRMSGKTPAGGKDLPAVDCKEHLHRQPSAELPPNGK